MLNSIHMALQSCTNQIQTALKSCKNQIQTPTQSQTADCNTTINTNNKSIIIKPNNTFITLSQFKRETYQFAQNSKNEEIRSMLKYTDEEMNKLFHLLNYGTEEQILDYIENTKQYFASRSIKPQTKCITINPMICGQPSKYKLNYDTEQEILELEKQKLEKQNLEILDDVLEKVKDKLNIAISDNKKKK
eukprot:486733_1